MEDSGVALHHERRALGVGKTRVERAAFLQTPVCRRGSVS